MFESMESYYVLSDEDVDFMQSFGSVNKPMELKEFLPFWNSLTENEQNELRHFYLGY